MATNKSEMQRKYKQDWYLRNKNKVHTNNRKWAERTGYWASFYQKNKERLIKKSRIAYFNRKFGLLKNREDVLTKYNDSCAECFISNKSHKEKYGMEINVHHIDETRNNDLSNLIPLCVRCHWNKHQDKIFEARKNYDKSIAAYKAWQTKIKRYGGNGLKYT